MSSANRRKNNTNRNSKRNSNLTSKLGLGSFTKDFPEVTKMGTKVHSNFMTVTNNKYFLYVMLFLGISTVLGFLSVKNFNAVVLFVVVAFAMRYFTKNMGVIMLVAVILSNIISVKSTIEGMAGEEDKERKKTKGKGKGKGKETIAKKSTGKKVTTTHNDDENDEEENNGDKQSAAMKKLMNLGPQEKKRDGMAPIDYEMSETVEVDEDYDDDDAIDTQSTQQAAYNNLNKLIGNKGFSKMTQDTEKLMSQQENLAKAMESIGPLVQNAEKMMQGLNLDRFTGMLDKLNGMMGGGGASAVKGASS